MWQIYVQADPDGSDAGGIAAWAGVFYNPDWPRYPMDIDPGDRVEIAGYLLDYNGKVNFNERHSPEPALQYTVTILEEGAGMPAPVLIPSIDDCDHFDETRATGGELYQAQWCRLEDVSIQSGSWAAGETVVVTDSSGKSLNVLLSERGDFDSYSAPQGTFTVTGVFDQEDPTSPYTGDYRLWVKSMGDVAAGWGPGDFDGNGVVGLGDFSLFSGKYGFASGGRGWNPAFDLEPNGAVGLGDFSLFAGLYGATYSYVLGATAASAPEPATSLVAGLLALILAVRLRSTP
jgi:hypothetical protein